jgi:parallel beta-helix repeat protein
MNCLRTRLNDGERFVVAAALAAVLVLLTGGAKALATANNVWCVPSLSVNPSCTKVPTEAIPSQLDTIQGAVTAAAPGDVIMVGPGTYYESVTITTVDLTILGAQAGKDARYRDGSRNESIVDGSKTGNPPFAVVSPSAPEGEVVVIDGFTLQGDIAATSPAFPAGIFLGAQAVAIQVLNNIIQNNSAGVFAVGSLGVVIEHNLFKNNNAGVGRLWATVSIPLIPSP